MIKRLLYIAVLLLTILVSQVSYAQVNDLDLAKEYFQNGEFEKALLYLPDLYDANPNHTIYEWYFTSLIETEDFKTAEKVVKQQVRREDRNLFLYVDWANLYAIQGKEKQASEKIDELIANLDKSRGQIQQLSRYFVEKQQAEVSLRILEKAKELNNGGYGYEFEVAEIKGAMGKYDEMIAAYLELLRINPSYLNSVRTALLRTLNFDEEPEYATLIQQEILKKIQQYPNITTYNEFLIWIQLQQKDFYGAYLQSKSLDLRFKEQGSRINNIAFLAYNNQDIRTAKKAFEYLVEQPEVNKSVRLKAKTYLLKIKTNEAVVENDTSAFQNIGEEYQTIIDNEGVIEETAELVSDYALLLAGKLNQADNCEKLLLEAINHGNLLKISLGKLKIALADFYVTQNNVWEASLLYIQVDKTFKEDVLGHEAKLKNSLVYYYTGSFEYAQSQLDVLKASTSKLISNDAIELSLLITDNLALDTITTPLEMFARGDLLLQQEQLTEAEQTYDSVMIAYPGHSLTDEVLLRKYELSYKRKQFENAAVFLQDLVQLDSTDILADKAIYLLAELYANKLNNEILAKENYKLIITKYPGSLYAAEARKKYRKLRGEEQKLMP